MISLMGFTVKYLSLMTSTTRNFATAVQRTVILLEWQAFKFVYPVYARDTALETIVELIKNKFFLWN
jgi:hypothetical protein